MSTYNGAKYLREQMNSLLAQRGVELNIVVRDDGSTDDTCSILEKEYPMVTLRKGSNIGCEPSFMELLYSAPVADYYAFCDQDDVWMEDKLETAVSRLEVLKEPGIYGCNLLACTETLKPIREVHDKQAIKTLVAHEKRDYVFNMHGCVLVWNSYLQRIIELYKPRWCFAHDTWVNSIGNAIGKMLIDGNSHIYYRLHENNTSGLAQSKMDRLIKGFRRYMGKDHPHRDLLAKEIIYGYNRYLDKQTVGYKQLELLSDYKSGITAKALLMFSESIKLKKFPDKVFWRLCILLGRY